MDLKNLPVCDRHPKLLSDDVIKSEIEKAVEKADSPDAKFIPHEEIKEKWESKRSAAETTSPLGRHLVDGYFQIFRFPVMYQGWEFDEWGYVGERSDGTRAIIMTNHGHYNLYVASVSELKQYMEDYTSALELSKEALELLEVKRNE